MWSFRTSATSEPHMLCMLNTLAVPMLTLITDSVANVIVIGINQVVNAWNAFVSSDIVNNFISSAMSGISTAIEQ